ncbi:MAG TPA: protein kinase [Longimicrobiales bacterium]|nr:protein kinase [Longimicrobiales bacterium]
MSDDLSRIRSALAGRYEVVRELGEGGNATVYLARDLRHDRDVALKVVRPELMGTLGLDRFRREIKIAAGLQHPAILPLLDSGEIDGLPYFATPYSQTSSLRDLLERQKVLPYERACAVVREIADGLDFAHDQGIVHRDVKPGNILMSGGHAVLADFGLARLVETDPEDRLTDSNDGVPGTVWYMSPEQLEGNLELDGRADVYSLACVAYEMLCGEPPFTGRTAWAVMARQASGTRMSVRVLRPDVPEATNEVIAKALERDPSRRYPTAGAFAEAFEESFGAPRYPSQAKGGWLRRVVPWSVAAAVIVAAVLAWPFGGGPDLNAQRVMVFPLVDSRPDQAGSTEGEEAAIMIGAALDHAEPLQWIDGWDWLDPEIREDMGGWTIRRGAVIAREQGVRYLIDGRIMVQDDSLRVLLRLHDAATGDLVRRSLVSGVLGIDRSTELSRRAVIELLPGLIDTSRPVSTDVLTRFRPAAVANWLQGEREYRRAEFDMALMLFERAVGLDSTMALAAIRGAQAAGWVLRPSVVENLLAVGLRNEAVLSTKHRHVAHGLRSYYEGDADRALERFGAALEVDPTWADAHMALGETFYHLLPRVGAAAGDAEAAFREALRFDPGFTPALVHLAELSIGRGDRAGARRYAAEVRADHGPVLAAAHLEMLQTCVDEGADAVDWMDEASASPLAVLETARLEAGGPRHRCAADGFRALAEGGPPAYGWAALLGLQSHLVATGRTDDARAAVDGAVGFARQQPYLFILDALAGAPFEAEAEAGVRELERASAPSSTTHLWAVGAWQATRGRADRTAAALEAARRFRSGPGPDPTRTDSLLVEVIAAWDAFARADTSAAIARLEALAPVDTPVNLAWGLWQGLGAERMLLARLYLEQREFERAIQVAGVLDHPQPMAFLPYRPESLRIRVEAAEALGRRADAAAYRQRLDGLREDPIAAGDRSPQS